MCGVWWWQGPGREQKAFEVWGLGTVILAIVLGVTLSVLSDAVESIYDPACTLSHFERSRRSYRAREVVQIRSVSNVYMRL